MVMRIAFRLPDVVIVNFLRFLNVFIWILGCEDNYSNTYIYVQNKESNR